jgi:hypothetical protein
VAGTVRATERHRTPPAESLTGFRPPFNESFIRETIERLIASQVIEVLACSGVSDLRFVERGGLKAVRVTAEVRNATSP